MRKNSIHLIVLNPALRQPYTKYSHYFIEKTIHFIRIFMSFLNLVKLTLRINQFVNYIASFTSKNPQIITKLSPLSGQHQNHYKNSTAYRLQYSDEA